MIKIGISGAAGRMGTAIAAVVAKDKDTKITLATEKAGTPGVGKEANGIKITDSLKDLAGVDVFVDFTTPAATVENVKTAAAAGKAMVIGTTGMSEAELAVVKEAAKKIPVVMATNYSVGINVMWKVLKDMTRYLKDDYDIDIVESHHRHKKDAPSGTAVTTAQVILGAKGLDYAKNVVTGRDGRENERPRDQLGVFAVRGGGVVGEHTVIYASDGDKLELKHTSISRETLAAGAVKAAKWVPGKKPGLYGMNDVLGL